MTVTADCVNQLLQIDLIATVRSSQSDEESTDENNACAAML